MLNAFETAPRSSAQRSLPPRRCRRSDGSDDHHTTPSVHIGAYSSTPMNSHASLRTRASRCHAVNGRKDTLMQAPKRKAG